MPCCSVGPAKGLVRESWGQAGAIPFAIHHLHACFAISARLGACDDALADLGVPVWAAVLLLLEDATLTKRCAT